MMTVNMTSDEGKQKKARDKSIMEILCEAGMVLSLGIIFAFTFKDNNYEAFIKWCILPVIFFVLKIFYALPEIGAAIGVALVFLQDIGISGVPAVSLAALVFVGILSIVKSDEIWDAAIKVCFGLVTGSVAEQRISKRTSKNKTKTKQNEK